MVEIICILDRSGSMGGLEDEVINSFNKFIKDQKAVEGKARVTLVLFDDHIETPFLQVKLKKFESIDNSIYFTRGMTSLNDAIGKTLNRDEFKESDKAIVWIQTDGAENSSQEYNSENVKKLVKEKTQKGWEFMFMGANIDAFGVGSSYGLKKGAIRDYDNNARGIQDNTTFASANTVAYRTNN